MTCYRCGKCCREFMATVPKHETSNLSEEFLDRMSFEEEQAYLEANCEFQGEKCKWLDDSGIQCTCLAYDRRGSDCVRYCEHQECKVGLLHFVRKLKRGEDLPEKLVTELKRHKWFNVVMSQTYE